MPARWPLSWTSAYWIAGAIARNRNVCCLPALTANRHQHRRSVALATLAMMAANGGITSATAEMMTAAMTEYRSTTAQAMTNKPMQIVMSTK